jgi:hypothetical protein
MTSSKGEPEGIGSPFVVYGNSETALTESQEQLTSGLSQGKRYHTIPSLTVWVRSEIPRADRKLTPNPDCKGGDVLTIWLLTNPARRLTRKRRDK